MENGQIEGPREFSIGYSAEVGEDGSIERDPARLVTIAIVPGCGIGPGAHHDVTFRCIPGEVATFRDNDDEIARLEARGREDGGIANHVPMTLSEADDSSRAWSAAVRAKLRAREDARRLPVQTEADPDVDNWPDAP